MATALVVAFGWIAIRGPQGFRSVREKRREILQLQEQNAALAYQNRLRAQRVQRLEHSRSEQEMEIRKQLKLLRPGETTFILPNAPRAQ